MRIPCRLARQREQTVGRIDRKHSLGGHLGLPRCRCSEIVPSSSANSTPFFHKKNQSGRTSLLLSPTLTCPGATSTFPPAFRAVSRGGSAPCDSGNDLGRGRREGGDHDGRANHENARPHLSPRGDAHKRGTACQRHSRCRQTTQARAAQLVLICGPHHRRDQHCQQCEIALLADTAGTRGSRRSFTIDCEHRCAFSPCSSVTRINIDVGALVEQQS